MRFIFIISFIWIEVAVMAQKPISKIVLDKESRKPVMFAHVYAKNNKFNGTVTNADGKFVLQNIKDDTLVISHLSYQVYQSVLQAMLSDTIFLIPKTQEIKEIHVTALSAYSIMEKVIDNIKKNHIMQPVMYQVFVRVSEYERDSSELHNVGEYLMNDYEKSNGKYQYRIIKVRVKPFSKAGEKAFKDRRMINASGSVEWANIFNPYVAVLKKRKLKTFRIEFIGEFDDENGAFFKLVCYPKKEDSKVQKVVLLIDKSSYGIKKYIEYYNDAEFNEVRYRQINNKWYIAYFRRRVHSDFYKELKYKKDSKGMLEWEAIYNIDPITKFDEELFKSYYGILVQPIKKYNGDWNDGFWEQYNFIPLPDWMKEKMKN